MNYKEHKDHQGACSLRDLRDLSGSL